VSTIRTALNEKYPTAHLVGRNGMHKYNNQDHAMMTAMLTAENILAGERKYDVWAVNQDAEYLEAGAVGEQTAAVEPWVPVAVPAKTDAAAALSRLNAARGVETGKSTP
jgi:protoporphyrinogen oxidase